MKTKNLVHYRVFPINASVTPITWQIIFNNVWFLIIYLFIINKDSFEWFEIYVLGISWCMLQQLIISWQKIATESLSVYTKTITARNTTYPHNFRGGNNNPLIEFYYVSSHMMALFCSVFIFLVLFFLFFFFFYNCLSFCHLSSDHCLFCPSRNCSSII